LRPVVVDASVAASWLLPDERDGRATDAALALKEADGLVPQLWHLEMRNLILMAIRRNRLVSEDGAERLSSLSQLPLETDVQPDLDAAFELAVRYELTYYDALYLELACRRRAALATFGARLLEAARSEGVAWD
jgi:predicted nucleic acid-binding protein